MSVNDSLTTFYLTYPEAAVLPAQMEVRGIIFAVAAAPEIPMPETWMPWVLSSARQPLTDDQVDNLAHHLMLTLRDTLQLMSTGQSCLPPACQWQTSTTARLPLTQWLTGLLKGHQQVEGIWLQAWDKAVAQPAQDSGIKREAPQKRLSRCLKLFSTLADPEGAMHQRSAEQATVLQAQLPRLAEQLPAMLKDYITLAGELAPFLPQQFESYQKTQNN
ncbi:UPF0149 family protein [Salinimonas sediminis]|uniref:UPF0149 family protein n=1 Tax=Salinimonas sediminis TaxID=2303538 RepID=UPI0014759B71|nr:UPF0149 family protein [Salinimonas sediminis]